MELESESNGKHSATYKNRKKIAKIAEFFLLIYAMRLLMWFFLYVSMRFLDAIFLKKKRLIRCDFNYDAIAIPDYYSGTAPDQGPRLIDKPEKLTNQ